MSSLKVSKPAPAARNIDLHFDTRDMVPFFTKIVDGVYHRPVVVTFLFPRNYSRKVRATSPSTMSKADVNGVNGSILEESGDEIASPGKDYDANEDDDALSTDLYQQRIHAAIKHAKIAKHFVVSVTDVVESRDASYKVIVRDYKDLLKEIKEEYDNNAAVEDYFKPSSIRWWIAYIDQVLLVFDRPSGKLAALVDKGKIQSRVKRKMEHHLWMLEQLKNPSAGGNEALHGGGNMRGSVFEGSLKLSESTEELLSQFDHYPEDIPRDDRASSPVLEGYNEGASSSTADEVIDDHAVVGKDDPKPIAEIDQVVAVEVQEEIDVYSTIQPTGSVTANILDDMSLTQLSQSLPEGGEPSHLPAVTPTKKKSHSAHSTTRQSTTGGSSSAASKTRLRSSMDNKKPPKTNDDGGRDHKTTNAPPSSASPSRHSSAFEKTRVRQSTSSPLRNSTSLPTIAHAEKVSKQHVTSGSSVYQPSVSSSSVSTSPIVITVSQERTNQLLESAYGVAATTKLFPAKYAREEELLRQSMQASLRPSSKAHKKRGSTAMGSISSVSRSHEGKLPSISLGGSSTAAAAEKSVASVKGSLFEYPVASFSVSAPLVAATTFTAASSDENEMTISEIAHHVADRVNREILYNDGILQQEQDEGGATTDEGGGEGGGGGAVFDPQYDPYRQVAIATSFLSLERSVSPQPRPVSPFAEETKQLKGSKKVAAEIIHRARKSVSGSSKFQVRKISYSEKKLLDSPFAKKIWIEPPVDDPTANNNSNSNNNGSSKSMVLPSPGVLSAMSLESTGGTMTPVTSPERSPPSRDPASSETDSHHRALSSATKKGSLVTRASSSSTTSSSGHHGQKKGPSKAQGHHKERRSVDATPATGGDPSPSVVMTVVVEGDGDMGSSALSPAPPASNVEELLLPMEQKTVEALPTSQNPSSKIIYLETDDSVTVGERLEMTIANLIPDATVNDDGNDTAGSTVDAVNDMGYDGHPAAVDPFIPAAVPEEEEEPFQALQEMTETAATAEGGQDVVEASSVEAAADPQLPSAE